MELQIIINAVSNSNLGYTAAELTFVQQGGLHKAGRVWGDCRVKWFGSRTCREIWCNVMYHAIYIYYTIYIYIYIQYTYYICIYIYIVYIYICFYVLYIIYKLLESIMLNMFFGAGHPRRHFSWGQRWCAGWCLEGGRKSGWLFWVKVVVSKPVLQRTLRISFNS